MLKTVLSFIGQILGSPSATTPLAGTEVVPIVQSGQVKNVSVTNLTAGRQVDMLRANISATPGGGFVNPAFVADDGTGSTRLVFLGSTYAGVPANKPWWHSYQDMYFGSDAAISINFVSGGSRVSMSGGNFVANGAGKGLTVTSPNGLITKTITINDAGVVTLI